MESLTRSHTGAHTGPMSGREMTNAELGRKLGVTESYASYLRNGRRMPSGTVLSKLVAELGMDGTELLRAYRSGPEAMATYLRDHLPRVD